MNIKVSRVILNKATLENALGVTIDNNEWNSICEEVVDTESCDTLIGQIEDLVTNIIENRKVDDVDTFDPDDEWHNNWESHEFGG